MMSADAANEQLRRRYSDEALAAIPRLLTLVDRNRYSPTYGCFDRSYWHYRTMDFPCGMSQEFCLPLALAYHHPFPDNPYYKKERLKELALAGVEFASRSAHPDGSCDDYFPFERALGAMVFSLYAMTETCLVLKELPRHFHDFFRRRADWLMQHNESGQLTNHQAFAALALHNVFEITGVKHFAEGRDQYLDIVESWQSPEGWFQEYEGADPGYQSCTIAFLAKLLKKVQKGNVRERILKMLRPAVEFSWHFMHPDGSYAGEYGSRNTYHFYPHGFEVMAEYDEKAGQIADQFLNLALPNRRRYFNDDDRMCAHYVYDWMQAYLDFHPVRPAPLNARANFTKIFPLAKMAVKKTDDYYAVMNLSKGGVMKVTTEKGPAYGDTGLIGKVKDERVVVSHRVDDYETKIEESADGALIASASGALCKRKSNLPTPARQILFRMLNLTLGRFASNFLRKVLQKILITGKPRTEYTFSRKFTLDAKTIRIENVIVKPSGAPDFVSLHVGSDATSIYVANSNVYQESVLLPWRDLSSCLAELNKSGRARMEWIAFPSDETPAP